MHLTMMSELKLYKLKGHFSNVVKTDWGRTGRLKADILSYSLCNIFIYYLFKLGLNGARKQPVQGLLGVCAAVYYIVNCRTYRKLYAKLCL